MNMIQNPLKINTPQENTVSRRSMLGLAGGGFAAFMLGASVVKTATHDPLPAWWRELQDVRAEIEDLSSQPGGGNYDTPQIIALSDREVELERLISSTKAKTAAGAAAQVEWVTSETSRGLYWHGQTAAMQSVADVLRGMV